MHYPEDVPDAVVNSEVAMMYCRCCMVLLVAGAVYQLSLFFPWKTIVDLTCVRSGSSPGVRAGAQIFVCFVKPKGLIPTNFPALA